VTNPRGPTSRFELKIDWDYPVYQTRAETDDDRTCSAEQRHALSAEAAFAYIAGEDRRPLLVLRECLKCNGTDDALLTRKADNERTMLMSRWFHCVKLPPDVLEEDHPFHVLFQDATTHLFFARRDGTGRQDLTGGQSRAELWTLMEKMLASEYQKKPETNLKQLLSLLDEFDRIDGEIQAVKGKIDDEIEASGADSPKLAKLQKELVQLEEAKAKARADAVRVSELKLKQEKQVKKAVGVGASPGPDEEG
jgi:hypothetical protein